MYGGGNKALQGIYDSRDLWDYSKISVCWNTSGFQNEKTQVREAVGNTWESYSNIDFIGWRDCQENEDIDIRITINDSQPGVTSGRFGKALQGLQ